MQNNWEELYQSGKRYVDNRIEYTKLSTIGSLANLGANMTFAIILICLLTLIFIFLEFILTWSIYTMTKDLQSAALYTLGFNIVLLILLLSILKGPIMRRLRDLFTRVLINQLQNQTEDETN